MSKVLELVAVALAVVIVMIVVTGCAPHLSRPEVIEAQTVGVRCAAKNQPYQSCAAVCDKFFGTIQQSQVCRQASARYIGE